MVLPSIYQKLVCFLVLMKTDRAGLRKLSFEILLKSENSVVSQKTY
jgi:hypothetical protein